MSAHVNQVVRTLGLLIAGAALLLTLEIFYSILLRQYSAAAQDSFLCGPFTSIFRELRSAPSR
jgi:hypothetical protein